MRPLFLAVVLVIARTAIAEDSAPEAVKQALEQFYGSYAAGKPADVLSFWSTTSPERAAAEKRLNDLFKAYEKFRVGALQISKYTVAGPDRATMRAEIAVSAVDSRTGKPSESLGSTHRTVSLVREAGTWKVWREVAAEEDLADELMVKQTNVERTELLAANRELTTVDLQKALNTRANKLRNEGKYDRAISIYDFIIDFAERSGDLSGVAETWVYIAFAHRSQGQYDRALAALEKSLLVREKAQDKVGIAKSISQIGYIYFLQGNYERALEEYRKALPALEESDDKLALAANVNNIGQVYMEQGDLTRALSEYERSLRLREVVGDPPGEARALASIGTVHQSQGAFDLAIEYYQKAQKRDSRPIMAGNMTHNIGGIYYQRGNYGQAMEHFQRALQIYETLAHQRFMAITLNFISLVHSVQGNYDAAMSFARRSLELHEKVGDQASIVRSLRTIGRIYQHQGQMDLAMEWYEKAKAPSEKVGNKENTADLVRGMADLYRQRADYERATPLYQESLALAEQMGDKARVVWSLHGIALVHLAQGDFEKALRFADRGAEIASAIGSLDDVWDTKTTAGRALHGLGRTAEARKALDDAITAIETLRTQLAGGEQDEQRFFEDKVPPYHAMIDLLVEQGSHAEAFQYAERAKARVLLDTLQRGRADVTKAMTADEVARESTLRGQIVSANRRISAETGRDTPDSERLASLKVELNSARTAYEVFQNRLYALHPELQVQRGDIDPPTLGEVSELLTDASSALLEYVLTEKHSYLFVLTRGSAVTPELTVLDLAINPSDLGKRIEGFRDRIARRDLDFRDSGRELFDLLIAPAQKHLAGKSTLILIPDGSLWELPFQALLTRSKRFVAEEYAVSYAPSGTTLRQMMQRKTGVREWSRSRQFLAFGNPSISSKTAAQAKAVLMAETLDPLPEAERQVLALARHYGTARSRVYVGADAREERLKSEAKDFRILQLATHGILNNASPMYSHVVLAQSKEGEEDGLLEAWEMMNVDLTADLVVLSACETARGRIGAGEGVVGMSWALFVAGVPSIIVSQWKVESASTTDLMLEFHRNLTGAKGKNRQSKARAMQLAAIRLLKSERYRHPFYWAAFVVIGDPR